MHKVASLLLCLSLGVAWYWLLWGSAYSEVAPPPSTMTTASSVVPGAGVPSAILPGAVGAAVEAPQRSAVATDPTAVSDDLQEVRVRVVDAATMVPVSAAQVFWYDQSFDWTKVTEADREAQSYDPEAFLRQRGQTAFADGEGRVVLRLHGLASLMGRKGDLYGASTWHPQTPAIATGPFVGEFVLRLRPDRTLVVRTVDAQRQPVAGVVVRLTLTRRQADGAEGRSAMDLPASGSDGLTQLRHAQEHFPPEPRVHAASLHARLTGAEGEPVAIDPAALPEGPVDVVVPACGSVLVELLGPDGLPWLSPAGSSLSVRLTLASWNGGSLEKGINNETFDSRGCATFSHVRCGVRLALSGPSGWERGSEFDGPTRQGEQVRMALRMPADASLMAGRVLGEDGAPFQGDVTVRFEGQRGSGGSGLSLDGEGRFLVPVPDWVGRTPSILLYEQGRHQAPRREAEVVLRGPLVPGRNDLGDLVLRQPPLLVAGQVVVAAGVLATDILGHVFVELERCAPGERESWQQAHEFGARLDAEGRFEVRGHARGQKFRILVRGNCAPQPPREFVPGTADLRLEVTAGSTVSATFLVTPSWENLSYRLVAAAADGNAEQDWRQTSRERGWPSQDAQRIAVGWSGLAAGAYRLLVGCPGQDPLVDLVVEVPAGGPATDPRLRDIDLGGRVRAVVVRVTDAVGKRFVGKATVALRGRIETGAQWHGQPFDEQSGDGERFLLSQPTDMLVAAEGHRGVVVAGVFADTTVALLPAPKVTLHWVDAPALPEGVTVGLQWTVVGWPSNGPSLTVARGGRTESGGADRLLGLDRLPRRFTDGRATVVWEPPFPVKVRVILHQKGRRSQFLPNTAAVLDPAQLVDGQTIELRADPAAVQAALDKLAGK